MSMTSACSRRSPSVVLALCHAHFGTSRIASRTVGDRIPDRELEALGGQRADQGVGVAGAVGPDQTWLVPPPVGQPAQCLLERGGRPAGYDVLAYRHRNVVERCLNTLKNGRGIATRYDKKVLVYRGGVVLAAILIWLS
jgi:hypothetical protein